MSEKKREKKGSKRPRSRSPSTEPPQKKSRPEEAMNPVLNWSIKQVGDWARDVVGVLEKHVAKLIEQEINGKSLASMTREDFERCGIPVGPAAELFEGVKELFPERFGAPTGALLGTLSPLQGRPLLEFASSSSSFTRVYIALDTATMRKTTFWKWALSTPVPTFNTIVTLPDDCNWLDEETGSKSTPMLVRKSFVEIFDSMMAIVSSNPRIRGYVTLGNPGIGKSRFLSYCLWRYAKLGKRVFFESVEHGAVWSFEPSGHVSKRARGPEFPFETTVDDLYLFDPYGDQPDEPRGCSALTIVAASPNPIHYKGFRKRKGCGVRFFMPVWTEGELELFRSATESLTVSVLHSRFFIFGGIPRYIFKETREFLHAKSELDVAIIEGSSDSLHVLRAALGNMESGNKISHKLIHYKVDTTTYESAVVRYASAYVERELPLKAPANRLKDLGRVLCDVADTDIVMEGHIFEEYLHRMIPLGVTMVARSLQSLTSKHVEITFAKRTVEFFDDTAGLTRALKAKSYTRPNQTNYTAIDAVSWLDDRVVFLQYTRSTKHEITMDQLTFYEDLVAVRKIDRSQKIRFFFIVPSNEYETFKPQHIHVPPRMKEKTNKGKHNRDYVADIDTKVKFVNDYVEQWVATLKFD